MWTSHIQVAMRGRLCCVVVEAQRTKLITLLYIYYSKFAKDHCLGWHYISRHGYHAKTKHGMYSRTCLFHECQCCIPNLNNISHALCH